MPLNSVVTITLISSVTNIIPSSLITPSMSTTWAGYPYEWMVSMKVKVQNHSDPNTATPFAYTGLDIQAGDWLVFNNYSIAVEIQSVNIATETTVTALVQDKELWNLLNDPTQSAQNIGPVSEPGVYDCLLVRPNAQGIPIFNNQPEFNLPQDLINDIQQRFLAEGVSPLPAGPTGAVQFNAGNSTVGGSANLVWDGVTLNSTALRGQNIVIANDMIRNAVANMDLTLRGGDGTGKVVVQGDLVVQGKPSGTAPYVTGVMYVTLDGNDLNDGLTEDRAKRTIAAAAATAANQIRFRGWTYATIYVRAGEYREPNPIIINSGITIMGDNLRSVTVIPENPYQDILWLNPKTYVTGITFRGHRHPAAVIAFPADGVSVINDVHEWTSPYVQNCSSITIGEYDDEGNIIAEAGTGMVVDGDRGRKLSDNTEFNVSVFRPDAVVGPSTFVVYKDIAPNLGSQLFGPTGGAPGWQVQSGTLDAPVQVLSVGETIQGPGVTPNAWTVTVDSNNLATLSVPKWDAVQTDTQVVVLDSTFPNLGNQLETNWTLTEQALTHAQTLLNANRGFFQAEITAYVTTNFPGLLNPTQLALCTRDVGLILNAFIKDILSGNRDACLAAGKAYWVGNTSLIPGQFNETTTAIDYLKQLCINVLNNETITPTYQNLVAQITYPWLTGASLAAPVIINGASLISNTILHGAQVDFYQNAADLLVSNRAFIQQEIMGYVTENWPQIAFDSDKFGDDLLNLLDAIQSDMLNGKHAGSVAFALTYFDGDASLISGDAEHLVSAFNWGRFLTVCVINNIQVTTTYQTLVPQHVDVTKVGGDTCNQIVIDAFDIITSIILEGPSVRPARESIQTGMEDAFTLMLLNRAFMQAEVVAYVNATYPDFVYDQAKCGRDVGLLVDAVSWDIYWGGLERATQAGKAYWDGSYLAVRGEVTQTVAAITYLKQLATNIITKTVVSSPYQNVVSQVIPGGLSGGAIATTRSSTAFDLIQDLIEYGPQASAPVPGLGNAAQLLQLNKVYLAKKVQQFIAVTYPAFVYDVAKCERDVGYIVDCMCADIVSGRDSESRAAGLAYWNGATSLIPGEQTQTVAAIAYLKSLSVLVVQNITISDAYVVPETQTIQPQLSGGVMAVATMSANYDLIGSIITSGVGAGAITVSAQDAAALLTLNRNFVQAEVIAYVNLTYPTLLYDAALCSRDVGLILDGLCNDLLVGGHSSCLTSGRYYWKGTQSLVQGQQTETVAALNFAKTLFLDIISNTPITPLQPGVSQQFDVLLDGTAAGTQVTNCVDLITSVITNGANTGTLLSKGFIDAHTLLTQNRAFLAAQTVSYVNYTYPSLTYSEVKCERDAGLIVDAICADLLSGTDTQSVEAGSAYWTGVNNVLPVNERLPTIAAITYLKQISLQVITNTPVDISTFAPAGAQTQYTNIAYDGTIASDSITDNFDIIIDLITNGPTQVPIYITGSSTVTSVRSMMWNGAPAWEINFAEPLGGFYFGAFEFYSWNGPVVMVPPSTLRPYQGTGLNSMVMDAFTQYNQISIPGRSGGGHGIVIRNGGYAQLVSVFTICCNIAVLVESGGTCSITNSNTDFGHYGLWAHSMSDLQYTATMESVIGAGTSNIQYLISGLPEYDNGSNTYKRPYVGQVISVSKYLSDLGYTADLFYYIETINVTNPGSGYDPLMPPNVTIESPSQFSGGFVAQAAANVIEDPENPGDYIVGSITLLVTGNMFTAQQLASPTFITIDPPVSGTQATATATGYPNYYIILESSEPVMGSCAIILDDVLPFEPDTPSSPNGASQIKFFQVSRIIASSHCFEYVGTGSDIATAIPARGGVPKQNQEIVMTMGGKVAFTSTDHLGNFRIGQELLLNQNTNLLSGRSFQKSLYAIMTPYILAIEGI